MTVQARFDAAVDLHRRGRVAEAERLYHDVLAREPDHVAALVNLAVAAGVRGRLADAEALYARAGRLRPEAADIQTNLGLVQVMRERLDDAEASFRRALAAEPDNALAGNNLGGVLFRKGRLDQAADAYRAVLRRRPDFAEAHDNLGAVLQATGAFEAALACHREALRLEPGRAGALCNRGNAQRALGAFDDALADYAEALVQRPGWPHAEWNRALAHLLKGDFEAGWPGYEWRVAAGVARLPDLPWPRWAGESPQGATMLVYGEQGVGDEVMFASCLPDLLARAARCVVVCEPRLAPVLARSFPAAEVRGSRRGEAGDVEGVGAIDYWVPAGDLPRHLRRGPADFPRHDGYLVADADRRRAWRARLAGLGGALRVGISWRGGSPGIERLRRSTGLELWAPLAAIPGLRLVNLQYGDCRDELARARREAGLEVATWDDLDPLRDLDGFFALLGALDLVISIDNATAHMAGALGRPVWTLLPIPPDWRWMTGRADTPWYPSMTLHRQDSPGDWAGPFDRVARALRERLAARGAWARAPRPGC